MNRSDRAHTRHGDFTRSRGACFVCRAKKRKCSGLQPSCEQCTTSGSHCVWPRQQKRGIPKNLIKELEARLRRTETLLKHILPLVSDSQLQAVLLDQSLQATTTTNIAEDRLLDKENADPEIWKLYPLASVEDIREWQNLPKLSLTSVRLQETSVILIGEDSWHQDDDMRGGGTANGPTLVVGSGQEAAAAKSPGQHDTLDNNRIGVVQHGDAVMCNTARQTDVPPPSVSACGSPVTTRTHKSARASEEVQRGAGGYEVSNAAEDPAVSEESLLPVDFRRQFLW